MATHTCPKCGGRLICVSEFMLAGGGDLDTIKCINCGNRIASRPRATPTATPTKRPATVAAAKAPAQKVVKGKTVRACSHCGRIMPIIGRGYCSRCYYHHVIKSSAPKRRKGAPRKSSGNVGTPPCLDCGRPGLAQPARGLCKSCYTRHMVNGTLAQFSGRRVSEAPVPAKEQPAEAITITITGAVLSARSMAALQQLVEEMAAATA